MSDYILAMQGISKAFGSIRVLDNVNLNVRRGEIHALVGENGAGKSTLMKILGGVHDCEGTIVFDGQVTRFRDIAQSERAGISIIFQELNLVGAMTVCENMFLGAELTKGGLINWHEQYNRATELLKRVRLKADPDDIVADLGMGKQQLIEIAKALNKRSKLLILDEPTASLTEVDAANLLALLRELRSEGITCIYISHKLREVLDIADTVTILRDGRSILTKPAAELTEAEIIVHMVGRELTHRFPNKSHTPDRSKPVLEVRNWTVLNPRNPEKRLVSDVSLVAYPGEVLGIAGLMGAGRTELATSLIGALGAPATGELLVSGKRVAISSPVQAIKAGIAYVSEDRKRYGLVLSETVKNNVSLASLPRLTRLGVINASREVRDVQDKVRELRIKTSSLNQRTTNLSGGNQQKVILGKWLLTEPRILILDEPTRGIDVGAKFEIYQIIDRLARSGVCVVMISSEMPEVLGMSDRIYVMGGGRIRGELAMDGRVTPEMVLQYAQVGMRDEYATQ